MVVDGYRMYTNMDALIPKNNTRYIADFLCTYKLFETGLEDEGNTNPEMVHDCDIMYRMQLIQACNGSDEMDEMNDILGELYETIHETVWCSRIMNKMMRSAPIGMDYETMFRALFGYEFFHKFHGCICEYFHSGKVSETKVDEICNMHIKMDS